MTAEMAADEEAKYAFIKTYKDVGNASMLNRAEVGTSLHRQNDRIDIACLYVASPIALSHLCVLRFGEEGRGSHLDRLEL